MLSAACYEIKLDHFFEMLCLCLDLRMYQDKLASLKRQLQQLQEGDWENIYSLLKLYKYILEILK